MRVNPDKMLRNRPLTILFLLLGLGVLQPALGQKVEKLKPLNQYHLSIPEPSDVCLSADGKSLWIVSDNGLVFKTDLKGQVVSKLPFTAFDLEAVYADGAYVYAVDERTRKVHKLSPLTGNQIRMAEVPYMASRNKGFESLTYNQTKRCFVLITEKDPTLIMEADTSFRVFNEVDYKGPSDISSCCWHNGKFYILSDEAHQIWECDPVNYQPERKWDIPVINPEGLAFDQDGNLLIVSDDRGILYNFGPLPSTSIKQ